MRRLAMTRGIWTWVAVALLLIIVLVLVEGRYGRRPGSGRFADCGGNSGGPKPIAHALTHDDLDQIVPGPRSDTKPMGSGNVQLTISAVPRVDDFGVDCFTTPAYANASYVVAQITYAPNQSTLPDAGWKNWTDHDKPAYLVVSASTVDPRHFHWAVLTEDAQGNVVRLRAGEGFPGNDKPYPGEAHWGLNGKHASDTSYMNTYRRLSSEAARGAVYPVSSEGNTAAPPKTLMTDPTAWFSCSQGCCTATAVF